MNGNGTERNEAAVTWYNAAEMFPRFVGPAISRTTLGTFGAA